MMGDVVEIGCSTTARVPPEKILQGALVSSLKEVVVIGERSDGSVYFAMSTADAPEINWLLDCAKRLLMDSIIDGNGPLDETE